MCILKTYFQFGMRPFIGIFIGIFIGMLIFSIFSSMSVSAATPDCEKALVDKGFIKARTFAVDAQGQLQLTSANVKFFTDQRTQVRETQRLLGSRYFEMDHATRRVVLALMLQTHAFVYGNPGGAKSAIARDLLATLSTLANGRTKIDAFALQLNQLMNDLSIKGHVDLEHDGKLTIVERIKNQDTLIQFSRGLLDEIDKGNPVALAALLDVLNEKIAQYGAVTVKARTKTVVCTGNMTIYEFLKVFEDQGMAPTATALLDRLVFKVFAHNYPVAPEARQAGILKGFERSAGAALKELTGPTDEQELATVTQKPSDLPEVDWVRLGQLALVSARFSPDIDGIVDKATEQTRQAYNNLRRTTEQEVTDSGGASLQPIYYPPQIVSMRNIMQYTKQTIAASILLDLMALPDNVLPTPILIKLIQKGIPIDRFSVWRLQDVLLTAAPGDPILEIVSSRSSTTYTLRYGGQVDELLKHPLDERERWMLEYIKKERQAFAKIYTDLMASLTRSTNEVSEILADLLGASLGESRNIEEFLTRVTSRSR